MNTNTSESPVIASPIISSPIISSDEPLPDFNDACAAGMPAGHRVFYFKFVGAVFGVLGTAGFAVYKLLDYLGFLN